jgi:hypothetical protein
MYVKLYDGVVKENSLWDIENSLLVIENSSLVMENSFVFQIIFC